MHRELTPILQEMANFNYAIHQKNQACLGKDEFERISKLSSNNFQKSANQISPYIYNGHQTDSFLMNGKQQHIISRTEQSINLSRQNISLSSSSSRAPLQSIESNSTLCNPVGNCNESKGETLNPGTAPSKQNETTSAQEPSFAHVKRLPLCLPKPPLTFISNPYVDLPEHVYRHGLIEDAKHFAMARGITVEFALSKWVQYSGSESSANGLLKMTCWLMDTFQETIKVQLAHAQARKEVLPKHFTIPTAELNEKVQECNAKSEKPSLPPTHVLAIHSNQARAGEENGLLIPCHAVLYVLQCVSLPRFGESTVTLETCENDDSVQSFPIVPILVPRPKEFVLLHQFIYNRDAAALLIELLPLQQIVLRAHQNTLQYQLATTSLNENTPYGSSLALFTNVILGIEEGVQLFCDKSASQYAIEFLSDQPAHDLFTIAYRINSVWANGVAIGFLDSSFWKALQTAWTLIVTALACKKGRYIDIESRGLDIGLRKDKN
jgi:hypothetical protein